MATLLAEVFVVLCMAKVTSLSPSVSNKYIYPYVVARTWGKADQYCQSEYGTRLASIHSQEDQVEVSALCDHSCWIGLSDRGREGVWKWSDGSPLDIGLYTCLLTKMYSLSLFRVVGQWRA